MGDSHWLFATEVQNTKNTGRKLTTDDVIFETIRIRIRPTYRQVSDGQTQKGVANGIIYDGGSRV